MSSSLPTEDAMDMAVDDFGLGPWDSDPTSSKGEDKEDLRSELLPRGNSLPDAGGSYDPNGPERLTSYASSGSEAFAELPSDANNPSARSDYYDRMTTGIVEYLWPDGDTGAFAQQEDEEQSASLPGAPKNDHVTDSALQGLGNDWSGYTIQDQTNPIGHPYTDYVTSSDLKGNKMHRQATNHALVNDLTAAFLKEFGKKDLTRRHVMAFLQKQNQPQYLASDVIRCLKLSHSIFVKDVLDEFPIAKMATHGGVSLAALRDKLIQLEIDNVTRPELAHQFRRCAARISLVIADLNKLEGRNG